MRKVLAAFEAGGNIDVVGDVSADGEAGRVVAVARRVVARDGEDYFGVAVRAYGDLPCHLRCGRVTRRADVDSADGAFVVGEFVVGNGAGGKPQRGDNHKYISCKLFHYHPGLLSPRSVLALRSDTGIENA